MCPEGEKEGLQAMSIRKGPAATEEREGEGEGTGKGSAAEVKKRTQGKKDAWPRARTQGQGGRDDNRRRRPHLTHF